MRHQCPTKTTILLHIFIKIDWQSQVIIPSYVIFNLYEQNTNYSIFLSLLCGIPINTVLYTNMNEYSVKEKRQEEIGGKYKRQWITLLLPSGVKYIYSLWLKPSLEVFPKLVRLPETSSPPTTAYRIHVNQSTVNVLNQLNLGYKIAVRGKTELKVSTHTRQSTTQTHSFMSWCVYFIILCVSVVRVKG